MESEENFSSLRGVEPESSVLYVVGTPIGNLQDLSKRSEEILSKVSCIACEDTRHTKKLLNTLNIKNNLISFNEYNSKTKTEQIIKLLKRGDSIALVSDAGMPLISDPGEYLVNAARKNNLDVICSPGPCAALTGLVSSGLPSNYFLFLGFIPKKNNEREKCLKMISNNLYTSIIYESPKRIKSFLKELNRYCDEDRIIHISKELTKKYEQHWSGSLIEISQEIDKTEPKGEYTIFVKGRETTRGGDDINKQDLKNDLNQLIKLGLKRSSAASYLAHKNGIKKNIIYNLI